MLDPNDVVATGFRDLFSQYTHLIDHDRAAVVAILEIDHGPETIVQIKQLANRLSRDFAPHVSEVALVGEPVLVHDGFSLIEKDGVRLATLTVGLLSLVVLISLADLRLMLLLAVIVLWSLTITKACMVELGIGLSLVSNVLTAVVTVVAVTTVLHLGIRFRNALRRGWDRKRASQRTLTILLLPIMWTCATDAVGFAALSASRIVPVQQFGVMIAVAAMAVCVATLLFSPVVLMLPSLAWNHSNNDAFKTWLRRRCLRAAHWFVEHRFQTIGVSLVVIAACTVGTWQAETETSFLRNFRDHSPIASAYQQVESNFGGAGVWDVSLPAPDQIDAKYLDLVSRLEDDLKAINVSGHQLTKILSIADVDQVAAKAPLLSFAAPSFRLAGMRLKMPVFFDALLTKRPQNRRLRIMLRSHEHLDADEKTELIRQVEETVSEHTQSPTWKAMCGDQPAAVSGYYVIMARLVKHLASDQWRCFLWSGAFVWLILVIANRSLVLATAALVPNLLPIFLVLSLLSLLGDKINLGAAMIAAVSIGLSIDGSVHFLASYRRHRAAGHSKEMAAVVGAGRVGVPVVFATAALVIGFAILANSDFVPTSTFGLLAAVTMTTGTIINLTLLPAFVTGFDR